MQDLVISSDKDSIVQRVANCIAKALEEGIKDSSPHVDEIPIDFVIFVLSIKVHDEFTVSERAEARKCFETLIERMENVAAFEEDHKQEILDLVVKK
jgi:hypothetical protein